MRILISGGTGFVGKALTKALQSQGHTIYICTRVPNNAEDNSHITFVSYEDLHTLPHIDACINLAGESLFGYWTDKKKQAILSSRTSVTKTLVDFAANQHVKPSVFISGSAVGFYGTSDEKIFTEETTKPGDDFLAHVATAWEDSASPIEALGVRTVYTRFGVILGEQGSFPLMQLPVKLFVGGKIGNGEQWLSWIHIDDVVQAIVACLENPHIHGPVNVTAPSPVRNDHLMKAIAQSLQRPYCFPTPTHVMRLALGEMSMLITEGQYVLPRKLQAIDSFTYAHPTITDALKSLHT